MIKNNINYNVSVIVPVYNGEKYIRRCLDSIVNQTIFEKIQVIVVNDGSKDNTFSILQSYKKKYKNLVIIDVPNGGVSKARNIGIKEAAGEYITFVDADDWIDINYYEKMYEFAVCYSADIVSSGFYISDGIEDIVENCVAESVTVKSKIESIYDFLIGNLDVHCVDKLFKSSVIKNNEFNIELKTGEDRVFLYNAISSSEKMVVIPYVYYHYYQNSESVMHSTSVFLSLNGLKATEMILNAVSNNFAEMVPYAEAMYISMACRVYCDNYKDKNDNIVSLRNKIKNYSIIMGYKYMSKKHLIALILAKNCPAIFCKLRNNTFIRFKK